MHMLLIAALASCGSDDDDNNNNDDRANQAMAEGDARGGELSGQARTDFGGATNDDEAIAKAASIVLTLDTGEIAQASFILTLDVDSSVRDLASEIQADHQANAAKLDAMLQDRGLTPADNPVSTSLQGEAMTGLEKLRAESKDDAERDYTEMQIMMHQAGFVLVGTVRDLVDDEDFRQFLSETRDAIAKHRDHARDVLDDLD